MDVPNKRIASCITALPSKRCVCLPRAGHARGCPLMVEEIRNFHAWLQGAIPHIHSLATRLKTTVDIR
eukprot:2686750-Pyramimonas_sp.AAC.1